MTIHYTFFRSPTIIISGSRYIARIAEAAKRSPELIQLLELHMQFSTITPYGKSAEPGHMIEKPLTKRDSGIQTDVNIRITCIPYNILSFEDIPSSCISYFNENSNLNFDLELYLYFDLAHFEKTDYVSYL